MRFTRLRLTLCILPVVVAACEHATAPPQPASIQVSPPSVSGTIGTAVSPAPTFTVVDDKGKPIADVAVTVAVGSGGGTLTGAPKTSGASATSIGSWVLGPMPGTNTLIISAAGVPSVTVTADAKSAYSIDLRFFGAAIDPAILSAFRAAKSRIESIVTTDVPDITTGSFDVSACGATGAGVAPLPIDDIVIYAAVDSIDGLGKVLGSSGPCYVRTTGGLPLISIMHFDSADVRGLVNDGRINDVILHEMLHALGVGTLWAGKGLVQGAGTASSAYTGINAINGCQFHGGGAGCVSNVPLETTGGAGTRDVHWREAPSSTGIGFRTELMTGFVSPAGTPNPLSRITIGSLADLGYIVNFSAADAYTVPSTAAALYAEIATAQGHGALEIAEVLMAPRFTVDAQGRVTRIPR